VDVDANVDHVVVAEIAVQILDGFGLSFSL